MSRRLNSAAISASGARRLRRFPVLNGLDRDQSFPTGHRVKTVVE
jgi:hypothetical protein